MNLLLKLCNVKPSSRYKIEQALTHPWITRKLDDKIPRTGIEENIYIYEIDSKLRYVRLFKTNVKYIFIVCQYTIIPFCCEEL